MRRGDKLQPTARDSTFVANAGIPKRMIHCRNKRCSISALMADESAIDYESVLATLKSRLRRLMELRPICFSLAVLIISSPALRSQSADDAPPTVLKSQHFDRDPGWEASNNRVVPKSYPTINQDFGFSRTNFAGNGPGELGGLVTRAFEPAFYAAKIGPQTLNDKLTASGSFAITKTTPGGGVFFGFFRAEQPGGGGRPTSSLGMHFDSEHSGARLAVRLITGKNQSCGTFTTPFIPGKFRPTPIRNDACALRLDARL